MKILRILKESLILAFGLLCYAVSKNNFERSYQALINLYCHTSGKSRDILSAIVAKTSPFQSEPIKSDLFPHVDSKRIEEIVSEIQAKGYSTFEVKLSEHIIQKFKDYAEKNPGEVRVTDGNESKKTIKAIFDPANALGVRYDFSGAELIQQDFIQDLVADPFFVEIAGRYLKSTPYLDLAVMWWSAKHKDKPDINAAQLFHFDMDRIKWLKVFFYLTDVGPDNGPHYFVEGTHLTNQIPSQILRKGYARITDAEVESLIDKKRIKEFTGPKGTFFFEDTSGLHKGQMVHGDARLVFEIQYSNSFFGPPTIIQVPAPIKRTKKFEQMMKKYNWCE